MLILMILSYLHLLKVKNYYLSFLIGLEFISSIILYLLLMNFDQVWMFLFMMVYLICEVVVGLSLLVSLNFMYGHDKISLLVMC